jgi:hypothetical protein
MGAIKSIVLGALAGAIATFTAYEGICWLFMNFWTGWDRVAWDMSPASLSAMPDLQLPQTLGATGWGAAWGAIYGLILGNKPDGSMTVRGAILGLFLPALLGAFLLIPILTNQYAPFFGGDISKIIPSLAMWAGAGAVTAWVYGLFSHGHLPGFGPND